MNLIPISYSYDPEADAIMIKVENYKHDETIELDDNILMDFNKHGEFIALEILSLSDVLDTSIESLENIKGVNLIVKVTDYQIFVSAVFTFSVENHNEVKATNASAINNINIPLTETIATA